MNDEYISPEPDAGIAIAPMDTRQSPTMFFVERPVRGGIRRIQLSGPPDPGEPYDLLVPATRLGSAYELLFIVRGKPKRLLIESDLLRDFERLRPSLWKHGIFLSPKMKKIWSAVLVEAEVQ